MKAAYILMPLLGVLLNFVQVSQQQDGSIISPDLLPDSVKGLFSDDSWKNFDFVWGDGDNTGDPAPLPPVVDNPPKSADGGYSWLSWLGGGGKKGGSKGKGPITYVIYPGQSKTEHVEAESAGDGSAAAQDIDGDITVFSKGNGRAEGDEETSDGKDEYVTTAPGGASYIYQIIGGKGGKQVSQQQGGSGLQGWWSKFGGGKGKGSKDSGDSTTSYEQYFGGGGDKSGDQSGGGKKGGAGWWSWFGGKNGGSKTKETTTGGGQIQCSPPKCDPPCQLDYSSQPCPSCVCIQTSGGEVTLSPIDQGDITLSPIENPGGGGGGYKWWNWNLGGKGGGGGNQGSKTIIKTTSKATANAGGNGRNWLLGWWGGKGGGSGGGGGGNDDQTITLSPIEQPGSGDGGADVTLSPIENPGGGGGWWRRWGGRGGGGNIGGGVTKKYVFGGGNLGGGTTSSIGTAVSGSQGAGQDVGAPSPFGGGNGGGGLSRWFSMFGRGGGGKLCLLRRNPL